MKQKIEWYREVLELEPGSRVFFPLAKLLAADGQTSDAILTLRQGVLRHPEHVEARLLLVELLHLQGVASDLHIELEKLGNLLGSYPGFWKAWSERLASIPAMRDASLAMRFFAAALQGQPVTWGSIIEHGLQAILSKGEQRGTMVFSAPKTTAQEEAAMRMAAVPPKVELLFTPPGIEGAPDSARAKEPDTVKAAPETQKKPAAPDFVFSDVQEAGPLPGTGNDSAEDDEPEEAFSLRTRSMAEVLAEQGDIAGALEILHELMLTAAPEERTSLEARAEELSHRVPAGSAADAVRTDEKSGSPGGESTRLVDLLESLAQRLEARAR